MEDGYRRIHQSSLDDTMRKAQTFSPLPVVANIRVENDRPTHQRKYLPTLAELIDRRSIVQLKEIFIGEFREEFRKEGALIDSDIQTILEEKAGAGRHMTAKAVHAISMIMLTNRYIWENESKARQGGPDQDRLLKLTHSINGVRNTAKNVISVEFGDRLDHKVDCFASELVADFGNWNVF